MRIVRHDRHVDQPPALPYQDCVQYQQTSCPLDQIQHSKQDNPDDIDKVPVQAEHFDADIILAIVLAPTRVVDDIQAPQHADDHVDSVESRRCIEARTKAVKL